MSNYESIRGTRVKYLTSDPTLDSSTEGQVWYNSTSGTNKALVQIKAWSAGGNLPTATNNNGSATQGTQTASLSFGGGNTLPQTIEYNGFAWTTSNNLGTPRYVIRGAGVQTAALGFGGYTLAPNGYSAATEEYDGSSWTAGGSLPSARGNVGSNGTQTAALAVGGFPLSPGNNTEEYDGTTWTAGGGYPVALQDLAVAGPQIAALGAGGISGPPTGGKTLVCNYDGSSWTALSGTIPNGQNRGQTAGGQTHAVVFGGNTTAAGPPNGVVTTATNEWDGSTFSITANMATARQSYGGAGTATAAIGFAGDLNPGASNATEEYFSSIDAYSPSSLTAWSSGGNLNNNSQGRAGFGTQTTAVAGPGVGPGGGIATTENYDGSAWTNGASSTRSPTDLNRYVAGAGTPTAGAIASGGYPGTMTAATEEYDGATWTAGGTMNTARRGYVFDGAVVTSSLVFGGNTQPHPGTTTVTGATEHYDGTSWTTGGTMGTARTNGAGSSGGSQTSSLSTGGSQPTLTSNTEEYNGTSWTEVNNQPIAVAYQGYAGTQTDCLVWNGYTPTAVTTTYNYDGTSWSSNPASLALARLNYHNNAGTASAAIVFGGEGPVGTVTTTEEFNTGSPATPTGAVASTLTTS